MPRNAQDKKELKVAAITGPKCQHCGVICHRAGYKLACAIIAQWFARERETYDFFFGQMPAEPPDYGAGSLPPIIGRFKPTPGYKPPTRPQTTTPTKPITGTPGSTGGATAPIGPGFDVGFGFGIFSEIGGDDPIMGQPLREQIYFKILEMYRAADSIDTLELAFAQEARFPPGVKLSQQYCDRCCHRHRMRQDKPKLAARLIKSREAGGVTGRTYPLHVLQRGASMKLKRGSHADR